MFKNKNVLVTGSARNTGVGIAKVFASDERFADAPTWEPTEEERTDFELQFLAEGKTVWRGSYARA